MEKAEPMPALQDKKAEGYTASVRGTNLGEKEASALAEAMARLAAEQYVRSVFLGHTRAPLNRIAGQIVRVKRLIRKAYRNGA